MKKKQSRPETWCPWRATQGRGMRRIMGVILALLLLTFSSPPAQAIGPYGGGSDTVVDRGTGLEWQKSDDATPRNWQNALAYCENLSLDSKTDWRLPNIRELKSIVDIRRFYPAVDPAFTSQMAYYWSATTVTNHPTTSAWTVSFANGDDNWYVKSKSYYVRCVRAGVSVPQPSR